MINMYHNINGKKQAGAAVLVIVVILLIAAMATFVYTANHSALQQKSSSNQYSNSQAYEAAQAGLEFGIQYLARNYTTVTGSPTGGFFTYGSSDTNITNTALANGSKYSIVYTNPTANNYQLIKITSTGISSDGSATRTVSAIVQQKPLMATIPTNPSTVLGTATLQGSANVTNMQSNSTIVAGSTISFQGSASTTTAAGGSNKNNTGTDIQPNAPSLTGIDANAFFLKYFSASQTTIQNSVANFYASGSSPNLDGMSGTSIWVDGDYTQTGNTTIGTATAPVLLIVNGNFSIGGNVTIYGYVFTTGDISSSNGTPDIIGGFAAAGNLSLQGNPSITYDNTVLTVTSSITSLYPKVPGSWKDF